MRATAVVCAAICALASGCVIHVEGGSGVRGETIVEGLEPFDSIEIDGDITEVRIRHCDGCAALRITGDDNLITMVDYRVRDGKLELEIDEWIGRTMPLEIQVKTSALRAIDASDGVRVSSQDVFSQSFEIDASGGSRVELLGTVGTLDVEVSGGSKATVEGEISRLSSDASGGSHVNAYGVMNGEVELEMSGGSSADVRGVSSSLRADLSGGSTLDASRLDARRATLDASGGSTAQVCSEGEVTVEASGGSSVVQGCAQ